MSDGDEMNIPITGDSSGLIDAFIKATDAGANMADRLGDFGNQLGNQFKQVGAEILKMASAFVVAQVGVEAFKKAMALATDGMAKARQIALDSAAIGATAEQYQRVTEAAEEFGVSAETMTSSLERLNVAIGRASKEGGEAAEKFKDIGLNVKVLKDMNPEDRMLAIADAIHNLGDRTLQTEAAVSLFGRSGMRLVSVLAQGGSAFKSLSDEAQRSGQVISNIQVAQVAALAKQAHELDQRMEAASITVATKLGPAINMIKEQWVNFNTEAYKSSSIFEDVSQVLVYVSAFIANIAKGMMLVYEVGRLGAKGLFELITIGVLGIADAVSQVAIFIGTKFMEGWEVAKSAGKLFADAISIIWNSIRLAVGETISWMVDKFVSAMRTMADALTFLPGTDEMVEGIRGFANEAEAFSKRISEDVESGMEEAKKAVVDDTEEMKQRLAQLFTTMPDTSIKAIDDEIGEWSESLFATAEEADKANQALAELELPWIAANNAAREYRRTINDMANTPAAKPSGGISMADEGGSVDESSKEAEKYLQSVQDAMGKALSLQASAAAKERAEYSERLKMFAEYYREKGLIASDAEKAMEALSTEHQVKLTQAENEAEINRLTQQLNNEHIGLEQKQMALDNLRRAEQMSAEIQTANAKAAMERQTEVLTEQEKKDREAGIKSMINYDEQRTLVTQTYLTEKERIETESNERTKAAEIQLADERRAIYQAGMSALGGVLGQAAGLMDQHNRAQFQAWKVFASGQAVINALLSFSNIMGDPKVELMFGPTGQIALAYTSLALGMAAAAKIASTPFGGTGGGGGLGGGSGGGGGGGSGAAAAREMNPAQTNVNVALHGQNFSADQVRGLISLINQQQSQNMVVKMSN